VFCLKISGDGIVNGIVASYQTPLKEHNPHTEGYWGGIQGALPSISIIFFLNMMTKNLTLTAIY
jgi:hypothetical protein